MVGRALAADPHVLSVLAAGGEVARWSNAFTAGVALVEPATPISPEFRSRPSVIWVRVVGADGEAVEVLEELLGEDRVRRQPSHIITIPQTVAATFETIAGEQPPPPRGLRRVCARTGP